jgi:RimJ/RimL family protein N-acetyltransferase
VLRPWTMPNQVPITLRDSVVLLDPLSLEHADALWDVSSSSPEDYLLTSVPKSAAAMREYIEVALADRTSGVALPFVTRDAKTGRVVGSTRFMNIEHWTWKVASELQREPDAIDAVEIGATWLGPEARRTAINTHAKLLMLAHAFDAWHVRRVTLKTDARNARSRRAIERLGARLDGVLRAHGPAFDGVVRDTAFFSIVGDEWPSVKERLLSLASRP